MPDFIPILMNTLQHEGGETWDTGGHTNYGVTQDTYNNYAKVNQLPNKNVKDLGFGDVKNVYFTEYFKKPKFDAIPSDKVAGVLFDFGVNAGVGKATKELQKVVGVKPDGKIGKQTINAVDTYIKKNGEDFLASQLLNARANHYLELVTANPQKYGKYQQGWLNRISKLKEQYKLNENGV